MYVVIESYSLPCRTRLDCGAHGYSHARQLKRASPRCIDEAGAAAAAADHAVQERLTVETPLICEEDGNHISSQHSESDEKRNMITGDG